MTETPNRISTACSSCYGWRNFLMIQSVSSWLRKSFQGGMGVPALPCWMVCSNRLSLLSFKALGSKDGPSPPFRYKPWQEPQSFLSMFCSTSCLAAEGSPAATLPLNSSNAAKPPRISIFDIGVVTADIADIAITQGTGDGVHDVGDPGFVTILL